ncbi:MAG: YdeI/OmpD-associated family protein [Myxococcaceae bacterium]
MNPNVDWFFEKATPWKREYQALRKMLLGSGLTEELKWGCPCYTHGGANVVLIHGFKAYCALLFMKGALLKDKDRLLVQQTKNVQSERQIRFSTLAEIIGKAKAVKAYVREAIKFEKAGLTVKPKAVSEYEVPAEFQSRLDEDAALRKAFHALTPGRQRGYLLYFSRAKQAKTRHTRVEKWAPQILKGKGLDD